ncbi:FlgD immunoglobulin-like domain containing protein [Conexibacter sp. JD483]|uniref:N,N-dimethylformamidase beta subunit family domain-containing protein n=1 Tax=unclassified Conexibacter TaxID=2627773 RepID=UPI002721F033|nr:MULTISPECIES: N,N-dimethylformamidase beta subunit family domain-containing protein [unclassified Conexibacter]MDO8186351.1 FlgD immunoglobulin-like domain containing protein [Conexibacter sp. CPCC 205706]MDO8197556.1 FlgD immunoglobulin-like domain containing protein [Conexibacter sp. CPCC 205762]MDR9369622.1 FlgD immunoglobulin-like domain containing protein [Conexibacter sp. JD483]
MTRAARIVFALLVVATLGAFVVTQKLKSSPPLIVRPDVSVVFSPVSRDKPRARRARISFWLQKADDVQISIVDAEGRIVATIADGEHVPYRVRKHWSWNGRTKDGRRAPDGYYRVRVALLRQGRTADLPDIRIALDTKPPKPRVTAVRPEESSGPAFLPQRDLDAVTVSIRGTEGRQAALQVWRTDVTPARLVETVEIRARQPSVEWDGTIGGEPAPAGTYLMGLEVADRAGNVGTFPAALPPRSGAVRGRAGVTVRYLAAATPLTPVQAGRVTTVRVDARGRRYTWALRRWGEPQVLARGRGDDSRLRLRAPRGQAGLHVLTIATRAHRTQVPLVVSAPVDRRVLVVLPALTWEGLNAVDDDGDGMPNVLDGAGRDGSVRLGRPLAKGMPATVAGHEGALLRFLDANLLRYDLTTDAALAAGVGPSLDGYRAAVFAGDSRWVTPQLRRDLRRRVEAGGRIWSLGTDALRRNVRLADGVLSHAGSPLPTDALGARPQQPLVTAADGETFALTSFLPGPVLSETNGYFSGYDAYEPLASIVPEATYTDQAGPDADTTVIGAWRLGDGFAVHTGLPQLAQLAADGDSSSVQLVQSIWSALAR